MCPYRSELSIHSHCQKSNYSKENVIDRIKSNLRAIIVSCLEGNGFSLKCLDYVKELIFFIV